MHARGRGRQTSVQSRLHFHIVTCRTAARSTVRSGRSGRSESGRRLSSLSLAGPHCTARHAVDRSAALWSSRVLDGFRPIIAGQYSVEYLLEDQGYNICALSIGVFTSRQVCVDTPDRGGMREQCEHNNRSDALNLDECRNSLKSCGSYET